MRPLVVIDTNVGVVANERAPQAGPECVLKCVKELDGVRAAHRVVLDNDGLIVDEYLKNLSLSGQPGAGDYFFKWLWERQWNPLYCQRVALTMRADQEFVAFPDDPELATFDPADRKFVAAAIASQEATPILNAADTDWWLFREPLARHGVRVEFLCPELMDGRGVNRR